MGGVEDDGLEYGYVMARNTRYVADSDDGQEKLPELRFAICYVTRRHGADDF